MAVVESEELFPKPTMELFLEWFNIRIGGSVFDTQKEDLKSE
jgi:hypothetical protein